MNQKSKEPKSAEQTLESIIDSSIKLTESGIKKSIPILERFFHKIDIYLKSKI